MQKKAQVYSKQGDVFAILPPGFDAETGTARFGYRLGEHTFQETLTFPASFDPDAHQTPVFQRLLGLSALVLGVSYYKLTAPFTLDASTIPLTEPERTFILDVYENGLAEFYARNNLKRFGKIDLISGTITHSQPQKPALQSRALLPIGGGKDSLVSVQLLEKSGKFFTPFAVNAKGPILTSVEEIGIPPIFVKRLLDPNMIRLAQEPGFYNGHVPSTAINSMIAALTALLFSYNRIILSNERSASEGNVEFDGRQANHQHSKSLSFERLISRTLSEATGGALTYFSLLRPFSEARIAQIFARETRFDHVFSSCNRNFKLSGHDGPLWCGECPKCHFTFLIMAPQMQRDRLISIIGQNLLDMPDHEHAFRELTGLAGQKPWECVGEILEAAACLWQLSGTTDWENDFIPKTLRPALEQQYGAEALETAWAGLMQDSAEHHLPSDMKAIIHAD